MSSVLFTLGGFQHFLIALREVGWYNIDIVGVGTGQFLSLVHMHKYRHPPYKIRPCVTTHLSGGVQVNKIMVVLLKIPIVCNF